MVTLVENKYCTEKDLCVTKVTVPLIEAAVFYSKERSNFILRKSLKLKRFITEYLSDIRTVMS